MNNPTLDSMMLDASSAAYDVVVNPDNTATLEGANDAGVVYTFDANGVLTNTSLAGYRVDKGFVDNTTGFKAIAFLNPVTKDRIIAFTGTENVLDLASDLQLGWNQWSRRNQEAILGYIRDSIAADGNNISFHLTGHSLGGGLAEYAAYYARTQLQSEFRANDPSFNLNLTLTTFNAMGVLDSLVSQHAGLDKGLVDQAMEGIYVAHYIREGDLVGLLGGGHVGETTSTVNGLVSNVYELGSNTLFLNTAHKLPAVYQENLAVARNYFPAYLDLDVSQYLVGTVVARQAQGVTDPKQLVLTLLTSISDTIKNGDDTEVNALMRWVITNLHDSGEISDLRHASLQGWDYAKAHRVGVLLPVLGVVLSDKVVNGTVDYSLQQLKDWAGPSAAPLIDKVLGDISRYFRTVETYLTPTSGGVSPLTEATDWLNAGYDFTVVWDGAQTLANQLTTNPSAIESLAKSNPLALLPSLTAPNSSDYSSDAAGQSAYNQALTLYNHKQNERTQVQTLYNQYVTETNNLTPLAFHTPRDPADWQTVIQGDQDPNSPHDTLAADPVTTQIRGLAGDDVLEGEAGDDYLWGGAGDDLLDGGTEADELQGEGGDDLLFGADGNDYLWGDSSANAVTHDTDPLVTAGNVTWHWRDRDVGLDGNDYLDEGEGDDQLMGGGGRDHLGSTELFPHASKTLFCKLAGYSNAAYRLAA